jgi:ribosomal protein L13
MSRTNNRKLRERVRKLEREVAIVRAANRTLGQISATLAAELEETKRFWDCEVDL